MYALDSISFPGFCGSYEEIHGWSKHHVNHFRFQSLSMLPHRKPTKTNVKKPPILLYKYTRTQDDILPTVLYFTKHPAALLKKLVRV